MGSFFCVDVHVLTVACSCLHISRCGCSLWYGSCCHKCCEWLGATVQPACSPAALRLPGEDRNRNSLCSVRSRFCCSCSFKAALPRPAFEITRERRLRTFIVVHSEIDQAERRWDNPSRWKAAAFIQQAESLRNDIQRGRSPATVANHVGRASQRPSTARDHGSNSWLSRRPMSTVEVVAPTTAAPAINVVSIGDALFERVAAHACAGIWDLVKTVKLIDTPSMQLVTDQMVMLTGVIGAQELADAGLLVALLSRRFCVLLSSCLCGIGSCLSSVDAHHK